MAWQLNLGGAPEPGAEHDGHAGERGPGRIQVQDARGTRAPINKESQMGAGIPNLPPPTFIKDADGLNPNLILADMVAAFQAAAGRTLQPAQVERLLINLYAYRESLVRNAIQYAGQQNLLAFAVFPMIDYLGQLLGVSRLGAQGAVTTLQFTLQNALTLPYTIPAGTQAGTADGEFVFATNADLIVPAATTVASITATCTTAGPNANGYLPGQSQRAAQPQRADRFGNQHHDDRRRLGARDRRPSAHPHPGRAQPVQCGRPGGRVPLLRARCRSFDHRRRRGVAAPGRSRSTS